MLVANKKTSMKAIDAILGADYPLKHDKKARSLLPSKADWELENRDRVQTIMDVVKTGRPSNKVGNRTVPYMGAE